MSCVCPIPLCRCPWFKDTRKEDEAAAHKNTETFMIVPKWLAASAVNLNHGYMTPIDGTKPRWVAGVGVGRSRVGLFTLLRQLHYLHNGVCMLDLLLRMSVVARFRAESSILPCCGCAGR